jgi:hypothetical protein
MVNILYEETQESNKVWCVRATVNNQEITSWRGEPQDRSVRVDAIKEIINHFDPRHRMWGPQWGTADNGIPYLLHRLPLMRNEVAIINLPSKQNKKPGRKARARAKARREKRRLQPGQGII